MNDYPDDWIYTPPAELKTYERDELLRLSKDPGLPDAIAEVCASVKASWFLFERDAIENIALTKRVTSMDGRPLPKLKRRRDKMRRAAEGIKALSPQDLGHALSASRIPIEAIETFLRVLDTHEPHSKTGKRINNHAGFSVAVELHRRSHPVVGTQDGLLVMCLEIVKEETGVTYDPYKIAVRLARQFRHRVPFHVMS